MYGRDEVKARSSIKGVKIWSVHSLALKGRKNKRWITFDKEQYVILWTAVHLL